MIPGGREQRRYLGQGGGLLAWARYGEQVQDRPGDLVAPPIMVSDIDADTTPRLAEAASVTPSGRPRADQAFHLGLDALITGLRRQLSQADDTR